MYSRRGRDATGLGARLLVAGMLAMALAWGSTAGASISISPAFVETRLDKGRASGAFVVTNIGSKPERYRVEALHFEFTRKGGLIKKEADAHSVADCIYFNPKEFSLPPRNKRTIRFAIVPKRKLGVGEYWAAMKLVSLDSPSATGTDAKGRKLTVKVVTTILVPIFAHVGKIRYDANIKELTLQKTEEAMTVHSTVTNRGNGRLFVKATYEILGPDGNLEGKGKLGKAYVLAGFERAFSQQLDSDLPRGDYTLRIRFEAEHLAETLTDRVDFHWDPPPSKSEKGEEGEGAEPGEGADEASLGIPDGLMPAATDLAPFSPPASGPGAELAFALAAVEPRLSRSFVEGITWEREECGPSESPPMRTPTYGPRPPDLGQLAAVPTSSSPGSAEKKRGR